MTAPPSRRCVPATCLLPSNRAGAYGGKSAALVDPMPGINEPDCLLTGRAGLSHPNSAQRTTGEATTTGMMGGEGGIPEVHEVPSCGVQTAQGGSRLVRNGG